MLIKEIKLRDFRNYESLDLQFHSRVNIFLGNNAQGKTNLLEALYLSSVGKSFRTSRDTEMIGFGKDFCIVGVVAEKYGEELPVEIAITREGAKGIKADGVRLKKMSDMMQHVYCVIFSPEDLKIVKEEPEKRRKFMDRTLSRLRPSYYRCLSDYKKILQQRNALLKDIRLGKSGNMLDIWNERMAAYGSEIMMRRVEFTERLGEIGGEFHSSVTGGREIPDIYYEPDIGLSDTAEGQKKMIIEALAAAMTADIRNGTTGRGPHKDDICIKINGADVRKFASQGQQRTAALSLKLAELKLIKEDTGENPVLLLDDVMSELDEGRQSFLLESLRDTQIFITTTELTERVKSELPSGKIFNVCSGRITE